MASRVCVPTGVADPLWAGGPRRAVRTAQQQLCKAMAGGGAGAVTARSTTGGVGAPTGLRTTRPSTSAIRAHVPAINTASAEVSTCIIVMLPLVAIMCAKP